MSEVLPYDQWVESEEAVGLGELEKLKGYGDHYRLNSFASGNYNQEEADAVNKHLFGLAVGRGLVDQTDPEAAVDQFQSVGRGGVTPEEVGRMVNHMELTGGDRDEIRNLRVHQLYMQNPDTASDVLAESTERVDHLLLSEKVRQSEVAATQRGEKPLSVFENKDGTLAVTWDPLLEDQQLTDAQIAEYVKSDPAIDSNYLPAIRAAREKPEGLTVSRSTASQIHEAKVVINQLRGEDVDSYKEAIVSELRQGDTAGAEEVARNLVSHPGILKREYSEGILVNALMDWGKQTNVSDNPQILSTGEIIMPRKFLVDPERFDAGVDQLDVTEGQKKLAKEQRIEYLKAATPQFHKAAASFGMSEYVDLYEQRKAEGKKDHEIVEEWFSNEENFSKAEQFFQSSLFSVMEGFGGLIGYPAALLNNKEAKQTMGSLMKHEMARQEYANLFGEKLSGRGSGWYGFGYTLMRTAPAMAADIALAIPTGGVAGFASATMRTGMRWSMRQAMKLQWASTLSASTKALTAKALGGTGKVSVALSKTGSDLNRFMSKAWPTMRGTRYASLTAFNRSAGATYVSMTNTLEELHPDWSPQQVREAAYGHSVTNGLITVAVINTMGVMSVLFPKVIGQGVESWAAGTGGKGVNYRQLRSVYNQLASNPKKIPSELRHYLNMESYEEFSASIFKEVSKKALGTFFRHSFGEGIEEGVDQLINGYRDRLEIAKQGGESFDMFALWHETLTAAGVGAVMGLSGGVQEFGVRSKVTDRQRQNVEVDFYSRVSDQLADKGDLQSAAVLRGLVNKAREDQTLVTAQLEALGAEAKTEMAAIDEKDVRPLERIPRTEGELQRKIEAIEDYISQLEATATEAGVGPAGRRRPAAVLAPDSDEDIDVFEDEEGRGVVIGKEKFRPTHGVEIGEAGKGGVVLRGERTPETMRAIAGARHYRERLLALYEETVGTRKSFEEGLLGPEDVAIKETKAGEVPIADPTTGEPMSPLRDSGSATKIIDEKYNAKTEEEAKSVIETLNREISRLDTVGDPTPYQSQKLRHLSEQRDALREKFYPGTVERTPPANPKLEVKLRQTEMALGALRFKQRKNPSLVTNSQHRGRVQVLRTMRRALREAIANGSQKANPDAPVTSSTFDIEKLIRLLAPAIEGRGSKFYNPETGEVFEPRVDAKQALALLRQAQAKKDKRDNATIRKAQRGQKVTDDEIASLTQTGPEELFAEDFERINALVDLIDTRGIDTSADPEGAAQLAALTLVQLEHQLRTEEEATNAIPASVVEEESRQAEESTKIPEPAERVRNFTNQDPEAEPQVISVRRRVPAFLLGLRGADDPVRVSQPFGNLDDRLGGILQDKGVITKGEQGPYEVIILNRRPTADEDFIPEENPTFDTFEQAEAAAEAIVSSLGESEGMTFADEVRETDAESEEAAAVSEGKLEKEELDLSTPQGIIAATQALAERTEALSERVAEKKRAEGGMPPQRTPRVPSADNPATILYAEDTGNPEAARRAGIPSRPDAGEPAPEVQIPPAPSLAFSGWAAPKVGEKVTLHHLDGSTVEATLDGVSKKGTKKYLTEDGTKIIIDPTTGESVKGWAENDWSPHVESPRYKLRSSGGIAEAIQGQEVNTLTDEQLKALGEHKAQLRKKVKGRFGEGAHTIAEADLQAIRAEQTRREQTAAPAPAPAQAPTPKTQKSGSEGFMEIYEAETKQLPQMRLQTGRERQRATAPTASELIDLRKTSGKTVHLDVIKVAPTLQQQGAGTAIMTRLSEIADATGTRITLDVEAFEGGPSKEKLKEFYTRFGFVTKRGKRMAREPKAPAPAQAPTPRAPRVPSADKPATILYAEDTGNPEAARRAGIPSRPDTVSPDTVLPVNSVAERAQEELVATKVEAMLRNVSEEEVIEKKVEEAQEKTTPVAGTFLSKFRQAVEDHPKAKFTVVMASGQMFAVQTNTRTKWDPSKDSSKKVKMKILSPKLSAKANLEEKWQVVWGASEQVQKKLRGKPLATQPILVRLNESTLYDSEGNIDFPAESDRKLFDEIVESGALPEPRHLGKNTLMGRRMFSLHSDYRSAFLRTAEAEIKKRSPVVPPPEEATMKKDPDPDLQEDKVLLRYMVVEQRGSSNAVYTYEDLVSRERELEVRLASLRSLGEERALPDVPARDPKTGKPRGIEERQSEQNAIDAAWEELISAEGELEDADVNFGYGSPEAEEWYYLSELMESNRRMEREGIEELVSLKQEYALVPRDSEGNPIVPLLPSMEGEEGVAVTTQEELQEWLDSAPAGRYALDASAYGLTDPGAQLFFVVTKVETEDGVVTHGTLEASLPNPDRMGPPIIVPAKSRQGDYSLLYKRVEDDLLPYYQEQARKEAKEDAKEAKRDLRTKKVKQQIEEVAMSATVPLEVVREEILRTLGEEKVAMYRRGPDPITGEWHTPFLVELSDLNKMVPLEGMTQEEFESRQNSITSRLDVLNNQSDILTNRLSEMTRPGSHPELEEAETRAFAARDNWNSTMSEVSSGAYNYAKVKKELSMLRGSMGAKPKNTELILKKAKDPEKVSRRKGRVTVSEFDPDRPTSTKQAKIANEFYKDNYRGVRAETSNRKISRKGFTHNGSLPMLLKKRRNEEGGIEYYETVFFTNDPKQMALALHLGYEIRVPTEYQEGGAKAGELNPAIVIRPDSGVIRKVFDPITRTAVRKKGDLVKWTGEEVYSITEVNRNSKRALYAEALPPVPASHTPHLGDTVFGQEASSVGSLYHTETVGGRLLTPQERLELAKEKLPGFKSIEQIKQEFRDTHKDPKTGVPLEISDERVDSFRSPEEKEVLAQIPLHTPLTRTRDGAPDMGWIQAASDYYDGVGKGARRSSVRSGLDREAERSLKAFMQTADRLRNEIEMLQGDVADEQMLSQPLIDKDILLALGKRALTEEEQQQILERKNRVNLAQLESLIKSAEEDLRAKEADRKSKEEAAQEVIEERALAQAKLRSQLTEIRETMAESTSATAEQTRGSGAVEESPGDLATNQLLRGLKEEHDRVQEELDLLDRSVEVDASDNYKVKLRMYARLKGSDADEAALKNAERELEEARKGVDDATALRLDYTLAAEAVEKAESNLQRLQFTQTTVDSIRERLGESPLDATIDDTIEELKKELEKEVKAHRSNLERINREGVALEEERATKGAVVRKDVEELKELVSKSGREETDARFDALIMYQQDLREFGLAVRLSEQDDPETFLRRLLDVDEKQKGLDPATGKGGRRHSFDRKAKEDFMNYLRSRYSVSMTPDITLEEINQRLERFAGEIPSEKQTSEITLTEAQVKALKGAAKTKKDQTLASRLGVKVQLKGQDFKALLTLADKAAKDEGLHPATRKSLEKLSDPKKMEEWVGNVKRTQQPTRDRNKSQAAQRVMHHLETKNKKGKRYSVKSLTRALSDVDADLTEAVDYLISYVESEYGTNGSATDSAILRNYIDLLLNDLDPTKGGTRTWDRTRWSRDPDSNPRPVPFKSIIRLLSSSYRQRLQGGSGKIGSLDEGMDQLENSEDSNNFSMLAKQLAAALVATPEGYQEGFMGLSPDAAQEVTSERVKEVQDAEFHVRIVNALRNPQALEALRGVHEHVTGIEASEATPVEDMWLTTHEALVGNPEIIEVIREESPQLARILQKVYQSGAASTGLQLGSELLEVIDANRSSWTTTLSKALSTQKAQPRKFTEKGTGRRLTGTFVSAREDSVRVRMGTGKGVKEVTIPLSRLSDDDVKYIRHQTARSTDRDMVSEGLTPTQTKTLLYYMANEDTTLSKKEKQLFQNTLKTLEKHGDFPSIEFLTKPSVAYSLWNGVYGEKGKTIYLNLTQRHSHKMGLLLRGLVVHAVNTVPQGTEAHKALLNEGKRIRKILASEGMQEVYLTQDMEPERGFLVPESEIRERISERMERRSRGEETTPAEVEAKVRSEQVHEDRRAFVFAMLDPEASNLMARREPNFIDRIVNVLAKILGLKGGIGRKRIRAYASPEPGTLFQDRPKFVRSEDMDVPNEMRQPLDILEGLVPHGHSIVYTPVYKSPGFTLSGAPNTIFINPEIVLHMVNGLPPHAIESVLQTLVDHELAHLSSIEVLTDADRASIISDISPTDMAEVKARVPEGSGAIEIAEEYLRMKLEEASYGVDGDRFVHSVLTYGTGLRAQVLRYVEGVLYKLANRFSKRRRPSLKTSLLLQRIKERMDRVKRGDIPLQPVSSQDINDYWEPLHEMGAQGTDRVFFSVPVWSSDGSHIENMDELKRNWKSTMKRELNLIEKGINFAENNESTVMKDLTKLVHRATSKGVVSVETINAALGSLESPISPEAQANLNAQREAERASMASAKGTLTKDQEKELLENHTKRVAEASRASEKERVRKMQLAQMAVDKADPNLGAAVKAYREEITRMSREVGGSKGGATKLLFDANAETHLIRSYEFFHSSVYRQAILDNGTLPGVDVSKLWDDAIDSVIAVYKEEGTGTKLTPQELRSKASKRLNTWLKSLVEQPPDSIQPLSVLSKGKGLFKERQDIPDPVQALMGVRGPVTSALHTHTKLAIFLAKNEAAKDLRKLLLSSGWVKTEPDFPNGVNTKLWSEYTGDEEYEPLQGLWTSSGDAAIIHEAMEQFLPLKADKSDSSAAMVQGLGAKVWEGTKKAPRTVAGTSLMMKTVFSLGHFARNEGSMNYVLRPLNGDFTSLLWFIPGTKFSGFRHADLARQGLGLGRIKEGDREYVSELIRRGMIKDGITAGLLGDIFDNTGDPVMQMRKDIEAWDKGQAPAPWIKKIWAARFAHLGTHPIASRLGVKAIPQFLTAINELIDSKAKIGLYEFEKSFLVKVRDEIGGTGPEWTDEAISKKAAAKVHATLPGHSQVWKPVKQFTGSAAGIMVFPFARFASETLRGYLGTARLIGTEWAEANRIGSSVMKRRAAMRAVGFIGTQVLASKALVTIFSAIFNMLGDDDDEQGTGEFKKLKGEWGRAMKRGLPKWMRNQTVYVRHNPDGSDTMFNMTYFNPLSILQDPGNVFLDALSMGEGFDVAAMRLVETIAVDTMGEGIAPGAIREMFSNSDDYGQKIFLPSMTPADKLKKFITYFYDEAFKPGIHSKSEQFVKAIQMNKESDDATRRYNARSILLGEVLGVRPQEYMTDETMKRSARSVKRDLDSIKAILKPLTSGRRLSPGESTELVHEYVDAYKDMWKQHLHTAEAWSEYTEDPGAYEKYMRYMIDAGHSKSRTYGVMMEKTLDRFVRNRDGMENIFNAGESTGAEGGEVRLEEFVQAILEYPEGMDLRE